MKKNDLKTGMVVVTRDNRSFTVLKDTIHGDILANNIIEDKGNLLGELLSQLNEDLTHSRNENLDIIGIYVPNGKRFYLDNYMDGIKFTETHRLVWGEYHY